MIGFGAGPALAARPVLRRRPRLSVGMSLLLRAGIAFGLIGIAVAVHWFDRAGLRDNLDGDVSFTDVLYFTMITVVTVGYGDIVPVTDRARMFDTFLVTPIRLFVWLIFLGTAYDFLFKRTLDSWRMAMIQKGLTDHIIVVGHGTSGAEAVIELISRGTAPERIVVIDRNIQSLNVAEKLGCAVMEADATRDATLQSVHVDRARSLVVSTGRDDTAILVVLTARRLAPNVPISVTIRASDNEPLARQAGADTVINPASFAGLLLAGSTHGSHIADYLADLASISGSVALHERVVAAHEVGRPLADLATGLGVRLYRDGVAHGFWEPEAASLRAGDVVVEIMRREAREA
jgi:voltage-gated potassium channel